jgi:HSP20 family molecular chaperone IbpA
MKPIHFSKELLMQADFLNTTGGGMTAPLIDISRDEEGYRVEIKISGVSIEKTRVEIINRQLLVYFGVSVFGSEAFREESEDVVQTLPYLLTNLPIPFDADVENISARYENGKLIIIAPVDNMSEGHQRSVEIEY